MKNTLLPEKRGSTPGNIVEKLIEIRQSKRNVNVTSRQRACSPSSPLSSPRSPSREFSQEEKQEIITS